MRYFEKHSKFSIPEVYKAVGSTLPRLKFFGKGDPGKIQKLEEALSKGKGLKFSKQYIPKKDVATALKTERTLKTKADIKAGKIVLGTMGAGLATFGLTKVLKDTGHTASSHGHRKQAGLDFSFGAIMRAIDARKANKFAKTFESNLSKKMTQGMNTTPVLNSLNKDYNNYQKFVEMGYSAKKGF